MTERAATMDPKHRKSTLGLLLVVLLVMFCALAAFLVDPTPSSGHPRASLVPRAYAQPEGHISARVDRSVVTEGDTFTLEISVTIKGQGSIERLAPPSFAPDLQVVSQSTSQRTNIINFDITRTQVLSYMLRPVSSGTVTIEPAEALVGGRTIRSKPIQIQVQPRPGAAPPLPQPAPGDTPPGAAGGTDPPGTSPPVGRGGPATGHVPAPVPGGELGQVALLASAHPQRLYVGQQATLTYSLATTVDLREYSSDDPDLTGFWVEPVERRNPRPTFRRQHLDGQLYHVAEVSRYLLFPLRPGTHTIPAVNYQVGITQGALGMSMQRHQDKSAPVTIQVLPLPQENVPSDFSGAVGEFSLRVALDKEEVHLGEPLMLTVTLEGRGNLRQVQLPALDPVDGLRIHEPTIRDSITITGGYLAGERQATWLVSPQRTGEIQIPSMRFSWFDPEVERYVTDQTPAMVLSVTEQPPGHGRLQPPVAPPHAPPSQQEQQEGRATLGSDDYPETGQPLHSIRPRAALDHLRPVEVPPYTRWPFWAVVVALPFLYSLLVLSERLRENQHRNTSRVRMKKACSRARRRLREAEDHIADSRPEKFFSEIARALSDYVEDRTGMKLGGMTMTALRISLEERGYPGPAVDDLIAELEHCDFARFAPGGDPRDEMSQSLARAREIIDGLERSQGRSGSSILPAGGRNTGSLPFILIAVLLIGASAHSRPAAALDGRNTAEPRTGVSLQDYFRRANNRYHAGDYEGAIRDYERVIRYQVRDAGLHYNLANAHLMAGRVGEAILNYERALWIEPRAADIRHNLHLTEQSVARGYPGHTLRRNLRRYNAAELTVAFVFLHFILFGLLFIRRKIPHHQHTSRTLTGATAIGLALLMGVVVGLISMDYAMRNTLRMAVSIHSEPVAVLEGPSPTARVTFTVSEGEKVRIVDEYFGDWLMIRDESGRQGWARSGHIEEVLTAPRR